MRAGLPRALLHGPGAGSSMGRLDDRGRSYPAQKIINRLMMLLGDFEQRVAAGLEI